MTDQLKWLRENSRCEISEDKNGLLVKVYQDQKGNKPGGWYFREKQLEEAIWKVKELKDMDPDRRVTIHIEKYAIKEDGGTDHYNKEKMYAYDLPRWMWNKYGWLIEWRRSKIQCQFPRNYVTTSCAFYDRSKTGKSIAGTNKAKLIKSKAMVTQIKNRLETFKCSYVPTLYEPNAEDSEFFKEGIKKLKKYEQQVIDLENLLES